MKEAANKGMVRPVLSMEARSGILIMMVYKRAAMFETRNYTFEEGNMTGILAELKS